MTATKSTPKATAQKIEPPVIEVPNANPDAEAARIRLDEADAETLHLASIRHDIVSEFILEQEAQDEKWGEQNHPNGTGSFADNWQAKVSRSKTDTAARSGVLTWKDILIEEVHEAFAESDPAKLRAELVQSAAVIAQWIAKIDRDAKKLADLADPQGIAE